MLSVAIELYVDIVPVIRGVFMTSLHRTADSEVLRKIKNIEFVIATNTQGIIRRTIIHHDIVISSIYDGLNGLAYAVSLIVGRDDNKNRTFGHDTPSSYSVRKKVNGILNRPKHPCKQTLAKYGLINKVRRNQKRSSIL